MEGDLNSTTVEDFLFVSENSSIWSSL